MLSHATNIGIFCQLAAGSKEEKIITAVKDMKECHNNLTDGLYTVTSLTKALVRAMGNYPSAEEGAAENQPAKRSREDLRIIADAPTGQSLINA